MIHAQVAGRRATERAASASDATGIPEDSGHKQEHGQKDLNWGKEDVKARQASRRLKLLMRRLREDERQRERAERDLRNLISQVQDYKQKGASTTRCGSEKTRRSN